MTVLAEDDLQITLPSGVVGRKFDDETSHGLSHCMKAVDFIVEMDDRPWKKPFVAGCAVMNLASWNKVLPHIPASRVGP